MAKTISISMTMTTNLILDDFVTWTYGGLMPIEIRNTRAMEP